jgi:hypothetical protein
MWKIKTGLSKEVLQSKTSVIKQVMKIDFYKASS